MRKLEFSSGVVRAFYYLACVLATVQVLRFYVAALPAHVSLQRYVDGTAPLPFQKRYLSVLILRGMMRIPSLLHVLERHHNTLAPPLRGCWLLLSGACLAAAGLLTVALYRRVSRAGVFSALVYPLYLVVVVWTFILRVEQNETYPYDFMSVLVFAAGTYCIYTRRFWWLLLVVALGTLNRETTALLVPLFVLDAISIDAATVAPKLRQRFTVHRVPLLKTLLLCVVWAGIELPLAWVFRFNDRSETHLRYRENLQWLSPDNWPALLNMCGFLLPLVFLLQRRLRPQRFANYVWIAVPWIVVMWMWALMAETRIYGELIPWTTVAALLLLERYTSMRLVQQEGTHEIAARAAA